MEILANNCRLFSLLLLALVSLLAPTVQETKTRLQAAGESLQWVQPKITGTAPTALIQHAMAYLPKWDKALIYGGTTPTGISGAVYALSGLSSNASE